MTVRDFDEGPPAEDRTFRIGGEEFVLQMVSGEVIAEYEDADLPASGQDSVDRLYKRLTAMLAPDDVPRFEAARAAGKVSYLALADVNRWASGIQSGRPTEAASPSQPGPGGTSPGSGRRSSKADSD